MRKILLLFILTFPVRQSFSQVNDKFRGLLDAAFKDEQVAKHIFSYSNSKGIATYLYLDETFEYYAFSSAEGKLNSPNWVDGMAHIFDVQNFKVFVFPSSIEFGAYTNFQADTVVVFDKIKFKPGSGLLLFHTTNLYPKIWQDKNGSAQKFVKIKCELIYDGKKWLVQEVKISNHRFKSIVDKE